LTNELEEQCEVSVGSANDEVEDGGGVVVIDSLVELAAAELDEELDEGEQVA
jgi:hypothetical protein